MKKKLVGAAFVAAAAALGGLVVLPSARADTAPVTVRTSDFIPSLGDTRANGLVTVGDNGAGVVTTKPATPTSPSPDKAAQYWTADIALADVSTSTLDWTGTVTQPGVQLVVDFDGDATTGSTKITNDGSVYNGADAILVGEDTVYGSGTDEHFWVSGSATDAVKGKAPADPAGGSQWNGTLAEWQAAFPDAKIVAVGFSLGSGAGNASGILKDVKVGTTTYDFAGKDAVVPPPAPPTTAPTNVQVISVSFNTVDLSWDPVPGAVGYRLYRSGVSQNVGASNDTIAQVGGLEPNSTYTFWVAAQKSSSSEATAPRSAPVSARTRVVVFTAPTAPVVTSVTTTSARVTTTAVKNSTGYNWWINGVAHGRSDGTSYTVHGLTPGTRYSVKVTADNATQAPGPYSPSVSFTTAK